MKYGVVGAPDEQEGSVVGVLDIVEDVDVALPEGTGGTVVTSWPRCRPLAEVGGVATVP